MGSYSDLYFGSISLASIKNDYDPYLLFLFQESDKTVTYTTIDESGLSQEYGDSDGDTPLILFSYACTAAVARSRLELMGYTRATAEKGFSMGLQAKLEKFEDYLQNMFREPNEARKHMTVMVDVLRSLTLEKWLKAFEEIQKHKYPKISWHLKGYDNYSPILQYMLSEDFFGFPGYDTRIFLRLIIDLFEGNEKLIYDFTSLANGGWVDEAEDLIGMLDEEVSANYSASRRFIVMTEGSSDTWIIQRSLKLLYPHLYDYFKFLDFEGAKLGGGAGVLANSIKAFAGAGIINRIIALFDYDTAAEIAMKPLYSIDLPSNIQVKQYPWLQLAESFPTIGPTGLIHTNINGLACSIELYLGEDVLRNEASEYNPVQWKGYDVNVKKYQGEITNKTEILNKFNAKLEACEKDNNLITTYDWRGIQLILNTLLTAFHEQDAELILNFEDSF